jgi:hypothetical protein
MTQMFSIPANLILVIGFLQFAITVGFVIYGCVKGWDKVLKDYKTKKEELTIDG